ncbi:MAG: hypothetical protein MRY83_20035 [Flavobacteriales bacterium]|nr:hypothetical protein [Flavobacteriales bacterium]
MKKIILFASIMCSSVFVWSQANINSWMLNTTGQKAQYYEVTGPPNNQQITLQTSNDFY